MAVTITLFDDDGEEMEVSLPSYKEVCSNCHGEGKHVDRAIDGNGLSREDFDEDPDFAESYFAGDYDVTCEECHGLRVVDVVDEEACQRQGKGEMLQRYYDRLEEERNHRAEIAAERRMGA